MLVCALSSVTLALRAARWRILLNAEGRVVFGTAFRATAAGYFANSFLPARSGELVRTLLISSASGLENGYVLATALSERIADAIALVSIAGIVLMRFRVDSSVLAGAARAFAIAGALGALVIIVLPLTGTVPERVLARTPMPRRVRPAVHAAVVSGIRGLEAFHSWPRLCGFLALTAVIWTIDAIAAVTAGAALGLDISLPLAFLMLSAMGLASALPSAPGYVGVFQFVAVVVLTPFGFSRSDAIAFVIVLQATSYAVNALWGAPNAFRRIGR